MKIDASELSEIEQDALAEIANMGVSRAAASLRQMVGEQVLLVGSGRQHRDPRRPPPNWSNEATRPKLVAVQQSFEGPFSGRALLIFPEAQSLELVRSIVGEEHSLEDVIDLEQEALAETGNIILNACLATIANVLRRTMRMSLPSIVRGDGDTLFEVQAAGQRQFGAVPLHRLHDQESGRSRLHRLAHGLALDRRAEGDRARLYRWHRTANRWPCWMTCPSSNSGRSSTRSMSASSCSTGRAASSAGMIG